MRFPTIGVLILWAIPGPLQAGKIRAPVSGEFKSGTTSSAVGSSLNAPVPLLFTAPLMSGVLAPELSPAIAPTPSAVQPETIAALPIPLTLPLPAAKNTPLPFQPATVKIIWNLSGMTSQPPQGETTADEGRAYFDQEALHSSESPTLAPVNLSAEIGMSGLTSEQIDTMRRHSQGLISVYDFIPRAPELRKKGGYSLGLASAYHSEKIIEDGGITMGEGENYSALSRMAGLTTWGEVYIKLFGNNEERTASFMDQITSQGKPIVFFLPRDVLDPPVGYVTAEEMHWLLKHPERMKHVTFVFGAYQTISKEALRTARLSPLSISPLSPDKRIEKLTHLFENFKP